MKSHFLLVFFVLLLTLVCSCSNKYDKHSAFEAAISSALVLERDTMLLNEPLFMRFELTNTFSDTIFVLDEDPQSFRVKVISTEGDTVRPNLKLYNSVGLHPMNPFYQIIVLKFNCICQIGW